MTLYFVSWDQYTHIIPQIFSGKKTHILAVLFAWRKKYRKYLQYILQSAKNTTKTSAKKQKRNSVKKVFQIFFVLLKKVNCIDPNLQIQVVILSPGWLVNPAGASGHRLRRPGRQTGRPGRQAGHPGRTRTKYFSFNQNAKS